MSPGNFGNVFNPAGTNERAHTGRDVGYLLSSRQFHEAKP